LTQNQNQILQFFRLHTIKFLGLLFIASALLGPSIIKMSHGIEKEIHYSCNNSDELHLHELEDICHYCTIHIKLKFIDFFHPIENVETVVISEPLISSLTNELYRFIDCKTLRGPPSLV